jgi:hypothetical protein
MRARRTLSVLGLASRRAGMCEAQCQEDRGGEEREKAAHG